MFERLRSRTRPFGRWLAMVGVVLLLLHSVWAYVEARRLARAALDIHHPVNPVPPRPASRLDDAARFYEAAALLVVDPGRAARIHHPIDEVTVPDREWLTAMGPALEMIDRGAALPDCRYVWRSQLPSLLAMRRLVEAGSIRTRERLREGDAKAARSSVEGSLQYLRVFTVAGQGVNMPLIVHLVRVQLVEIALGDLARFLNQAPPGIERARLQALVDAQILPNEVEDSVVAERDWILHKLLDNRHDVNWIVRPVQRHFALNAVDYMSQRAAAARAPWPDRLRAVRDVPRPWGPAAIAVPGFERSALRMARAAALTHTMSACLGIEQHRLAHGGALPETLDSRHIDPFTGGPLKYRREDSGYVVYSVGEDGQDDGGAVEKPYGWITQDTRPVKDVGYRITTRAGVSR